MKPLSFCEKGARVGGSKLCLLTAYIQTDDFESLRKMHANLLDTAIETIAGDFSNPQCFVLPTGGKGFGLDFSDEIDIKATLCEDVPPILKL
jgi:hypothetical protein